MLCCRVWRSRLVTATAVRIALTLLPQTGGIFVLSCQLTPEAFTKLEVDMRSLTELESRGVIVTCKAEEGSSSGTLQLGEYYLLYIRAATAVATLGALRRE